jgi:hypothetical protein
MLIDDVIDILSRENASLTDALLKTKILLYQIGKKELVEWVNNELNGYANQDEIPLYRIVPSEVVGHLINGMWQTPRQPIPLGHLNPKQRESLEKAKMGEPLAVLETIASQKTGVIQRHIPIEVNALLERGLANDFKVMSAWCEASVQSINSILVHVRSNLLDFLLELRDKIGEETTDINIKERVGSLDISNMFNHTILGSHNIFVFGHHNIQTVSLDLDSISSLRNFLQQLKGQLPKFDLRQEAEEQAVMQIDTLEKELTKPQPNSSVIQTAGNILFGLLMGVSSNFATDLVKLIAPIVRNLL